MPKANRVTRESGDFVITAYELQGKPLTAYKKRRKKKRT
jgi:hypothetical protein